MAMLLTVRHGYRPLAGPFPVMIAVADAVGYLAVLLTVLCGYRPASGPVPEGERVQAPESLFCHILILLPIL